MAPKQILDAEPLILSSSNCIDPKAARILAVMITVCVIFFVIIVGIFIAPFDNKRDGHPKFRIQENLKNPNASDGAIKMSITEYSNPGGAKIQAKQGELIFEDNFDAFDFDVWQHEITLSGGGSWEFQLYHNNRSNSYVKNGKLFIKPTLTSDKYGEEFLYSGEIQLEGGAPADRCTNGLFWGCQRKGNSRNILNPIMSARLRTLNAFAFKYGKVEVRAKLPLGDWLWPAVWLLPKSNNYGGWPASGEIDIMESRGNINLLNEQNVSIGVDQIGSTLHYGPYGEQNGWERTHFVKNLNNNQSFNQDFHIFGMEWTPEHIKFIVDNLVIGEISPQGRRGFWDLGEFGDSIENPWKYSTNQKMAPFDEQFFIIINLAVGGINGYFGDNTLNSGRKKPWKNSSGQGFLEFWNARSEWLPTWEGENSALQVDYVRVWAL